ncbi:tetratricopeptide repeat protein [Tahibacter amnicola]|uniref:tetratricopeptide repeat protein n=1 Tax=Tahibacter amnicola TaxID=2976241 RepID=UPI0021BE7835|nr:tetratricopeptide repeat protein [Tahibacter amnicola]
MNPTSNDRLFNLAMRQMQHGQLQEAMDTLCNVLAHQPDSALAHALLALCLRDRKRLSSAEQEAGAALALAPQLWFAHMAMGLVQQGLRKPELARTHLMTAIELAPTEDWPRRELGRHYLMLDQRTKALEWIESACAADPTDTANLALLAQWHLEGRAFDRAEAVAREALAIDPQSQDALVVLGWVALRQNRLEEAQEHAVWAVQQNPEDESALRLLVAIKTRRSPLLGLWFRFNSFLVGGGGTRMVLLLVGMYLAYRVLTLLLHDLEQPTAATMLNYVWLAFVIYTWVAPAQFQRMLRKELEQVKLKPDF